MKKLAIIVSHPIQYYAPVFKLLQQRGKVSIKVFYTWGESSLKKFDPGFNKEIAWDTPLLEGYPYEWVKNTANDPGTHHFTGIVTPSLIEQVNAWQPDALLIYGWGYHGHLKAIRYFKNKIPVIFRGDSTLLDEKKGIKTVLKSIFLIWVYRHIDYALFTGTNNKEYFKHYGLKEQQLIFAPHAVDNDKFATGIEAEADLLKEASGIHRDGLVVLFAGKLEEKKAPLQLLDAFRSLKYPGAHLLIVGNGPLEDELKQRAKNNGDVHFMDFQNQSRMPVVYKACDLFCLPSKGPGETWGLAVNEAMACGKAILASDKVGAAADLVKTGVNGAVFKTGSQNGLRDKLSDLVNTGKSELGKMGRHSKDMIKDWSFENQVMAIESIVDHG